MKKLVVHICRDLFKPSVSIQFIEYKNNRMSEPMEIIGMIGTYGSDLLHVVNLKSKHLLLKEKYNTMKQQKIKKEDFEVYDKYLDKTDSYRSLGGGRWYNHEMYSEAIGLNKKTFLNKIPFSNFILRCICYFVLGFLIGLLVHS